MATSLEAFLPLIRPHLEGCPDAVMRDSVRNACIRLARDSTLVRQYINAGDVVAGADDYTITPLADTEVVRIISLVYDKRELTRKTEEELDIIDSGWRTADPGNATYYSQPKPYRFRLNRIPAETITLGLLPRIASKPSLAATTVNDLLYDDWRETVKHGVLAELLEVPNKVWSDFKLSQWHGNRFNFGIQSARAESQTGFMKKSTAARARVWL